MILAENLGHEAHYYNTGGQPSNYSTYTVLHQMAFVTFYNLEKLFLRNIQNSCQELKKINVTSQG